MRLFIAINFDNETKAALIDCQNRLRRLGGGNFSTPDNLHLTLAFLGEVQENRLEELKALMDGISVPKLRLCFSKLGCFRGKGERGDELWWIGAEEAKALLRLQKELIDALLEAGFEPDAKAFKPHITLARRMDLGRVEKDKILKRPIITEVSRVSLMLSHRPGGVLTYTELYGKDEDNENGII